MNSRTSTEPFVPSAGSGCVRLPYNRDKIDFRCEDRFFPKRRERGTIYISKRKPRPSVLAPEAAAFIVRSRRTDPLSRGSFPQNGSREVCALSKISVATKCSDFLTKFARSQKKGQRNILRKEKWPRTENIDFHGEFSSVSKTEGAVY